MMLFYFFHFLLWGYVFRCVKCGATVFIDDRTWWRKGVFWCPGCKRPYINGKTTDFDSTLHPPWMRATKYPNLSDRQRAPLILNVGALTGMGLRARLLWIHAPAALLALAFTTYIFWMVGHFLISGVFIYQTRLNLGHPIEVSYSDAPMLFSALTLGQLSLGALAAGYGTESCYHVFRVLRPSLGWPLRPKFKFYRMGVTLIRIAVTLFAIWLCYFSAVVLFAN